MGSSAQHHFVIDKSNQLFAWGLGTSGQLGNNNTVDQLKPVKVSLTNVVNVAAGNAHSAAVNEAGELFTWGNNNEGQLGLNDINNRLTPTKISYLSDVVQVECGINNIFARTRDGRVFSVGRNFASTTLYGGLGVGAGLTNRDEFTQLNLSDVVKIAAQAYGGLALHADGTVSSWGYNPHGVIGDGTTITRDVPVKLTSLAGIVNIFAGHHHVGALSSTGDFFSWGYNGHGQLGDGTVTDRNSPVKVATGVEKATMGAFHTLFQKTDKTIWGAGYNAQGQLGLNDTGSRTSFTQLTTISHAVQLSSSYYNTYFLTETLETYAVGYAAYGQLANGTTTPNIMVPGKFTTVDGTTTVTPITLTENLRAKSYTVNQPTNILAECAAQSGIQNIVLKTTIPVGTDMKFLFSSDNLNWKTYDFTNKAWIVADKANALTVGLTKAQVEGLTAAELAPYDGIKFYVNSTMVTQDSGKTPMFSGIDAFVDLNKQTATVASMGINQNLNEPDYATFYVSRDNGVTWKQTKPDQLTDLSGLPEGKDIRVKAVLKDGQEIHGVSFSWI